MNEVYVFLIKYRYGDILLKKETTTLTSFIYRLFCCNRTCYYVGMAPVTSASRVVTFASRF